MTSPPASDPAPILHDAGHLSTPVDSVDGWLFEKSLSKPTSKASKRSLVCFLGGSFCVFFGDGFSFLGLVSLCLGFFFECISKPSLLHWQLGGWFQVLVVIILIVGGLEDVLESKLEHHQNHQQKDQNAQRSTKMAKIC